jgi:hypothetical protein
MPKYLAAIFLILFTFTACDPNMACKDITCENGGSCWEGECQCPKGFIGEFCEKLDPNFSCPTILSCIENNYVARDACTYSADRLYNSTISRLVTDTNAIAFSNFANSSFELIAKVEGLAINIESQLINGIVYNGEGEIDTTTYPYTISLTYKQGSAICIADYSLQ